ncbi:MAG: oligosaccharide flippase family protein, partial [Clostridia bacterium]|nr:oligosaccharide flippase family protein [Clostridia bacterium]
MNKTAKNSMIYLSGTVTTGILSFISTLVLTRVFSQKVYAMYGLLTTFHTMFTMIVSFGYDSAYMRFYYKQPFTGKRYLAECLKVPAVLFVLSALLLVEPGQHIIRFIFEERLARYIALLLIVYFFFSFISRFSLLTARMEERAGNFVISNFVGKVGFLGILAIVFFIAGSVSFDWVIISHAIAAVMATMINLVVYKKIWNRKNEKSETFERIELLKYGFPIMVNSAVALSTPFAEKLIIKGLAGWEILSVYTAAAIFQTVVLLLVATITNIWTPLVFKICEDEKKFKHILHNFGMVATILMALGTSMCILLRRWLVLLLDEKYFSVHIIAPVMLLAACFNMLFVIYSVGINIKKKTW